MRILFVIFLSTYFLMACGSDDCTPETIVGTYVGTSECDEVSDPTISVDDGPVTLIVKNVSGNSYTAEDENGDGYVFTVDGCNITIPPIELELFGIMFKTSGNGNFDGNNMTLNIDNTIDGEDVSCTVVATKS